ncbi:MAG: PilT protein domain protein [Planctomycetaceae bacterium]|nr:PilT protein domain protein [Planctomycetaceae bacterium]
MKLILDSNVALKLVLPEPDVAIAIQLLDDFNAGLHELLAPNFFPVEVAHALTRAERQGRVSDPWKLWQIVMGDCPQLFDADPLMQRAIEIASKARIGVYDCLYVALAEREGCNLVTADEKLIKNLPSFPIVSLSTL